MTHVLPVSFPLADVDPKRVAANVAVIAVHAVVFALLMLPSRWEPAAAPAPRTTTTIEIEPLRPAPDDVRRRTAAGHARLPRQSGTALSAPVAARG